MALFTTRGWLQDTEPIAEHRLALSTPALTALDAAFTRYAGVPQLRKPVQLILALLMVQLGLGFASYLARLEWMLNAPQPTTGIVISTVSHVAGGALLLATSVVLAIQTRRIISVRAQESVVATSSRKAVTV